MKTMSRIAPLVIVGALVVLFATGSLLARSPVFLLLQLIALAVNFWARASFPPKAFRVGPAPAGERFTRTGPYRIVRHPMYAAALLFFWAAIADRPSAVNLGLGLLVTGFIVARVRIEDALLMARFPDYAEYARTTKTLVPWVT